MGSTSLHPDCLAQGPVTHPGISTGNSPVIRPISFLWGTSCWSTTTVVLTRTNFIFSTQPLWFLWQQWKCRRNEEPGCKLSTSLQVSSKHHLKKLMEPLLPVDVFFSPPPLTVLQKGYVWTEDTGRPRGLVSVCSCWSETRSLALELHSVPKLPGEMAHMRTDHACLWRKSPAFIQPHLCKSVSKSWKSKLNFTWI